MFMKLQSAIWTTREARYREDIFAYWFLRQVKSESCSAVSNCLWSHGQYSPWNSSGQNTGVGSLSLLQGIFPIQGLNPGLRTAGGFFYQMNHQGSPRILEWVAYPFSRGSSQPRIQTGVSCITGRFFTNWAMREVCKTGRHCICEDK